jgi:SH3-like domain-containing protein
MLNSIRHALRGQSLMRRACPVYGIAMLLTFRSLAILGLLAVAAPARAADNEEVPYWASLRANEVNLRVGPAETYRIAWVYRREGLPMKVLRRMDGWRLVEDPDGARGWMLARFLTRERGAIVRGQELAEMREQGANGAKLLWRVEPGVSGKLGDCELGWCRFMVGAHAGYIAQDRLWGAGEP